MSKVLLAKIAATPIVALLALAPCAA